MEFLMAGGLIYADDVQTEFGGRVTIGPGNQDQTDPGNGMALVGTFSRSVELIIGAGAETNTLPDPTAFGMQLWLSVLSIAGGTRTITAANGINAAGNTQLVFNAATDLIKLEAVRINGNLRWRVMLNEGVDLS